MRSLIWYSMFLVAGMCFGFFMKESDAGFFSCLVILFILGTIYIFTDEAEKSYDNTNIYYINGKRFDDEDNIYYLNDYTDNRM